MEPTTKFIEYSNSTEKQIDKIKSQPCSWILPSEIWYPIICQALTFPGKDLSLYTIVCKHWLECCLVIKRELLNRDVHVSNLFCSFNKNLVSNSTTEPWAADMAAFLNYQGDNLRALNLFYCPIQEAQIAHLSNFKSLAKINLIGCSYIEPVALAHLARLTNVHTLEMPGCNSDLQFLTALKNLHALDISRCELDVSAIEHLALLTQLERLIFGPKSIASFKFLENFNHLTRLNCARSNFDNLGLKAISNLTQLKVLDISDTAITDEGFSSLSNLEGIQSLDLNSNEGVEDAPQHYQFLGKLTSLTTLHLFGLQLSDASLPFILNLKQLKYLSIHCTLIELQGLQYIANLTTLGSLAIGHANLTFTSLEEVELLTHLTLLTELDCSGDMSIEGIKKLSYLPNLAKFSLQSFNIDDNYLEALSHLTALEDIDLSSVSSISKAGLEHLKTLTRLRKLYLAESTLQPLVCWKKQSQWSFDGHHLKTITNDDGYPEPITFVDEDSSV